jgi:uncharacterized protein DUF4154
VCCLMVLLLVCGAIHGSSQPAEEWANEYQLKAAFVYKLMSFVEWPAGSVGDHVIVGFAGEGPWAAALTALVHGKRLRTFPIEVRDVHSQSEMRTCNVLIVAYPDSSRRREALLHVRNMSVLTIGDGEDFARMGGVIALVPRENTFQLAVNPRAAARANIKISSKLLTMAKLLSGGELP